VHDFVKESVQPLAKALAAVFYANINGTGLGVNKHTAERIPFVVEAPL
jgi:hypothetical protein